jgi:hypothetical protein
VARDQDAHFVVIGLAKIEKIEAGDEAKILVEVASGVEVSAKVGADGSEGTQPVNLLRLELVFAVDEADIDFESVAIFEELLDPVVQLEKGAEEDKPVVREPNDLFEIIIGGAGI